MGLGVSVEVRRCASLSEDEMRQLYGFSNELMAESADSFLNHMEQYDLAFIFREKSSTSGAKKAVGRLVGLSVWRTMDTDNSWVKVIVQGKLRIVHEYRRRSLHVVACLLYYAWKQLRHPLTRFFFFSIASVFNYVSMKRSVGRYYVLNNIHPPEERAIVAPLYSILDRAVKDDNFEVEEGTGAINVHVVIQPETFAEYPESYFDLPEAREYIALNPRYREGYDLSYVFPFSLANVVSMARRCWQQNRQPPRSARHDIQPLTCPAPSTSSS